MKVQHSTVIELPRDVDARTLKVALEQVPDNAHCSVDVLITEKDRPWESRRTDVSLHCVWEAKDVTP